MARDHDERPASGEPAHAFDAVPASAAAARPPLDAATRARIGRGLRLHYASVLALPVPDRLRALLDDLAARPDRESSL